MTTGKCAAPVSTHRSARVHFDAPNLGERMTPLVERVRRRSWDDMAAEIAALLRSVAPQNGSR